MSTCRTVARSLILVGTVAAGALGSAACQRPRPPALAIDAIKMADMGVTGAVLDISLRMRNTDPERLRIERFEYDLYLDGQRLGHGYHPDAVDLAGFAEAKVSSRFDLNFLLLPGAIKSLLQEDNVKAEMRGTCYVSRFWGLQGVPMQAAMDVKLRQPKPAPAAADGPPQEPAPAAPGRSGATRSKR